MLKPINPSLVPPQGWSVTIEGAGPPIVGDNYSLFVSQVLKRLQGNNLDKNGWKDEMLDLMCRQRPDIPCYDDEAPPERSVSGDDVRRFLTTMWETLKSGERAVSEEVQNKRVEICMKCPKMGFIACSFGCASTSEMISEFLIGRAVRNLPEVHKQSCQACGCYIEVKTMWPLNVLKAVDERTGTQPEYHPDCWILNEETPPTP